MLRLNKEFILINFLIGLLILSALSPVIAYNLESVTIQQPDFDSPELKFSKPTVASLEKPLLTSHDPIRIEDNGNFTAQNGVNFGSGTQGDPYIIDNWDIYGGTGGAGYGIYIGNTTKHFIIRNCSVYKANGNPGTYYQNTNIYFYNVKNGAIHNCTIDKANWYGIRIWGGTNNNNIITNNIIINNGREAIIFGNSNNNRAENNSISGVPILFNGISLFTGTNQVINNNTFTNTGIGIVNSFQNHEITNNTVNGKSIYYLKNSAGITVPSDVGQVILGNCRDSVISGLNISNTSLAISLGNCLNITVEDCEFKTNRFAGVNMRASDDCTIRNNIFIGKAQKTFGIYAESNGVNNIVENNAISDFEYGIYYQSSAADNKILHNTIFSCYRGIYLAITDFTAIENNTILNCGEYGAYLGSNADQNNVFNNNFINNNKGNVQGYDFTNNNDWNSSFGNETIMMYPEATAVINCKAPKIVH